MSPRAFVSMFAMLAIELGIVCIIAGYLTLQ